MRLYACYTPSHIQLFDQFVSSARDEFGPPTIDHRNSPRIDQSEGCRFRVRELQQRSEDGTFATDGFQATCLDKVDFILHALQTEIEPFLYSDVDVRFYGPVVDDLTRLLGDSDIAMQWDGPTGKHCTGFMVIRPSGDMIAFWGRVRERMVSLGEMDQDAFQKAPGGVVRGVVLPASYWTFGRNDKRWQPGMPVNPPADLLVHHANWTVGIENKLRLLDAVKNCMDKYDRGEKSAPSPSVEGFCYRPMPMTKTVYVDELGSSRDAVTAASFPKGEEIVIAKLQPAEPLIMRFPCRTIGGKPSITLDHVAVGPGGDLEFGIVERSLPFSEVTRMLEEQRRKLTGRQHHPLPLALVLQFWRGDKARALDLARLIADMEPEPREDMSDVCFIFARQENCPMDRDIHEAAKYVGAKFPVSHLETKVDVSKKYPGVCYDAWASAVQQLSDAYHTGALPYGNAFFFEADGCPIGSDWIDRLKKAHEETLLLGKRVTGSLMRFGGVDASHQVGGHINGTLAMHLSCWDDHPSLRRCPPKVAWDVMHGLVLRNEAGPSQIIRNHHGGRGLSESLYWEFAKETCFITSLKDGSAHHWARESVRNINEKRET